LGLGYAAVRARNPGIVYASISAFGHDGPHGNRPGFDDVIQATSGYMSLNVRGDGPIRTGGPVLDYATGMHATSAILAAVLMRQQTGTPPPPADNRDGPLLAWYESSDGYVMLAGYRPRHSRASAEQSDLTTSPSSPHGSSWREPKSSMQR
jgi:hypothetical protein